MNLPTFKSKLGSIMNDNKFDRTTANRKSGKINTKGLSKISYSPKVFKKKEERKNKLYNIMVLVDCSGSMTVHKRVEPTIEALKKFLPVLENMNGINLEVVGFNTFVYTIKHMSDKKMNYKHMEKVIPEYSWSTTDVDYKEVEGKMQYKIVRSSVDSYSSSAAQNADGLAVSYAVNRLLGKKGKNVIIVLSDGEPSAGKGLDLHNNYVDENVFGKIYKDKIYGDFDLKTEVRKAIQKNIAFISVGIQTDRVKQYYPRAGTAVVHDMDDLFSELIRVFNKQLKRE